MPTLVDDLCNIACLFSYRLCPLAVNKRAMNICMTPSWGEYLETSLILTQILVYSAVIQNDRPSKEQILETQSRLLRAIKVRSNTNGALWIRYSLPSLPHTVCIF